ncbi:hypothetical protein C7M84_016844 [Penaeus vannamei]|uniref:Major facilitator superfamily (MFS) profile domain-containing protein n=1 Tax=Penaeus vannamei TaxID=6689 RepID=A0A423SLU6_PENVA|nr:hypothetical protein C7M84_016844 [Penaeus vannamei]
MVPARVALAMISALGATMIYMIRINLSVAIVDMVVTVSATDASSRANTVPHCLEAQGGDMNQTGSVHLNSKNLLSLNNMTSTKLNFSDEQFADKLFLTSGQRGSVLAAFFYGYFLTGIVGGRLAETYGSKVVLGTSAFIGSLLTLLTPVAARTHYIALIVLRVAMGLAQGVSYPSMHAMVARWVPPSERPRFTAFVYICIGIIVTMPMCGFIIDSVGWPAVFYVSGCISLLWVFLWAGLMHESPLVHPRISAEEREYILDGIKAGHRLSLPLTSPLSFSPLSHTSPLTPPFPLSSSLSLLLSLPPSPLFLPLTTSPPFIPRCFPLPSLTPFTPSFPSPLSHLTLTPLHPLHPSPFPPTPPFHPLSPSPPFHPHSPLPSSLNPPFLPQPTHVPWKQMLSSPAFWATIVGHAGSMYGWNLLVTQLPTFMNSVLGFSIKSPSSPLPAFLPSLLPLVLTFPPPLSAFPSPCPPSSSRVFSSPPPPSQPVPLPPALTRLFTFLSPSCTHLLSSFAFLYLFTSLSSLGLSPPLLPPLLSPCPFPPQNGLLSSLPFLTRYLGGNGLSWLGDLLVAREWLQKRNSRRLFTSIGSYGGVSVKGRGRGKKQENPTRIVLSGAETNSLRTLALAGTPRLPISPRKRKWSLEQSQSRLLLESELEMGSLCANGVGLCVPAVMLAIVGYVGCNSAAAITILCIGTFSNGATVSGYVANQHDIAPNFAGTMLGISNMFAFGGAMLAPIIVGVMTPDQTPGQWQSAFWVATVIYVVAATFFFFACSAELQPWNFVGSGDAEGAKEREEGMTFLQERLKVQVVAKKDQNTRC